MTPPRELPDVIRERAWWVLWEILLRDPPVVLEAPEPPAPDLEPAPAPEADEAFVEFAPA